MMMEMMEMTMKSQPALIILYHLLFKLSPSGQQGETLT